jgi:hypothetical protein
MLTDAPWLTENNPISAMERGVGAGLQARAQDLGAMNAGQALKLSYDQLSASQEIERRKALLSAGQINADQALTAYKQDALSQYRQEQIADAQQRIKDQEDAHTAAADLLKSTHDDTAAFVEDAKKMGAADALAKHPNADKTVVNHVMSLEAEKAKPPKVGDKETTEQLFPATPAKSSWWGSTTAPAIPETKIIKTHFLSAADRPSPDQLVSVINPQGKRVKIRKSDFVNGQPPEGYSLPQ